MESKSMVREIRCDRRGFLGAAITTFAAAPIMAGSAAAHFEVASQTERATRPEAKMSFSSLKQIVAGVLNVGYAEDAPPTDLRSFFSTAGRTIFTPTLM
jgi:hypothetical protein